MEIWRGDKNTQPLSSRLGVLLVVVGIVAASPIIALGAAAAGETATGSESGIATETSHNPNTTENSSGTSGPANESSAAATDDPQNHTAIEDLLAGTAGSESDATESTGAPAADRAGSNTHTVTITVLARSGEMGAATDVVRDHGHIVASDGTRVTAEVPLGALTDVANASSVRFVRKPAPARTLDTGGEDEIRVTNLRNRTDAFTGDNVTVAVIDLDPFTDASTADVAYSPEQVIERRNTANGSIDSHGTKTAETVAEVAPNVSLRLIDVDTYTDLINEIEYLRTETDTDVISISLGFIGTDRQDGKAAVDAEIEAFVNNGGVYVTAAGNQANKNAWAGSYQDGDNDDVLNVTSDTELVDVTKPDSGSHSVFLQWNDWADKDTDYELEVVNVSGDVIRSSDNVQDGGTADPVEAVNIKSSDDDPHIRITYDDTSGKPDEFLTLASFDAEFTPSTSARTVTVPSTEETALTVGAYGPAANTTFDNRLEPFSSRGPTIDGDRKPEVVAPDGTRTTASANDSLFELQFGTSYAAPHAAGVVALGMSANNSFKGLAAVQTVQDTAQPVQGDEPNNQTGYGLINAEALLETVEAESPSVSNASAVDASDGDTVVTTKDNVSIATNASDAFELASVTANASAFGAGNVTLTDRNNDDIYNTTFAVDESAAAADGAYSITVTATDGAGNTNTTQTNSLTLNTSDQTPPALTNVTAVDLNGGNVTEDDSITLNATVTDADSGVATVTANASAFGVDSVTLTDRNDDTVYNATFAVNASNAAADGAYSINITATDAAGNQKSAQTGSLTLDASDQAPPSITEVTAVNLDGGNVTADDEIKLNATVTDPDSGVASVTANASAFGVNSVTLADGNDDTIYNATFAINDANAAADGTYRINITATDDAGNTNSALTDPLTLDTADQTPPSITGVTVVDLEDGNVTADDEIKLNATVTDEDSGVASVTANASAFGVDSVTLTDENDDTIYNATFSINVANAATDGSYRINITATDEAGNQDSALTDLLTLDTTDQTPPSITGATAVDLNGGNVTADDEIKLNATVTDADSGVASVTANASAFGVDSVTLTDENNDTIYDATFSINATDAATNGTYAIEVIAIDAAGNDVTSEMDSLRLRVSSDDDDDGGGGSDGPVIGGGGGGGGGGAPAPAPPEETTATPQPPTTPGEAQATDAVTVETRNRTAVTVRVDEAVRNTTSADAPVTIDAGISSEGGTIGVTTVSLRTTEVTAYETSLSASDTMPTDTSAPAETTVGAITVSHSVPDEEILTAAFTIEVDKQQFEGTNVQASRISLYRLHNGEWTRLTTDVVEETADSVTLQAVSPGLSIFALGSTDSTVQVENTSISNTRPFQGDTVSITANMTNTGTADRETAVEFVVGEETTTKTVSLPAGASQRVTHTVSLPRGEGSPELDVYVNGTYVGLIDVVEQASTFNGSEERVPTADTTPETESPPPQSTTRETALSGGSESTTSSTGTPGFGVVAAVTALLVGLILVRQRSHE